MLQFRLPDEVAIVDVARSPRGTCPASQCALVLAESHQYSSHGNVLSGSSVIAHQELSQPFQRSVAILVQVILAYVLIAALFFVLPFLAMMLFCELCADYRHADDFSAGQRRNPPEWRVSGQGRRVCLRHKLREQNNYIERLRRHARAASRGGGSEAEEESTEERRQREDNSPQP